MLKIMQVQQSKLNIHVFDGTQIKFCLSDIVTADCLIGLEPVISVVANLAIDFDTSFKRLR